MDIEQIKANSIIKLEFSTAYYQRLQNLVVRFAENQEPGYLQKVYKKIREKQELNEFEEDFETLLILINSLEIAAREQDLIEKVSVPDQS